MQPEIILKLEPVFRLNCIKRHFYGLIVHAVERKLSRPGGIEHDQTLAR